MACCKPCCGCRNCVENQKGKCCCGGANGSCCTEEQTCCANSCCDEACCRGVCCQPGERCCPEGSDTTQECCPPSRVCCDGVCCPPGYSCVNYECSPCPAGYTPCGAECCPPGQLCVDGECVPCPEGETPCGVECCTQEQTCCSNSCCDNVCCNGVCCPPGEACVDGACCPPHLQCGEECCAPNEVCCAGECCDLSTCIWVFDCGADGADSVFPLPDFGGTLSAVGCIKVVSGAYDAGVNSPSQQSSGITIRPNVPLREDFPVTGCPVIWFVKNRNANCETTNPDGSKGGGEVSEYQFKALRGSCSGDAVDITEQFIFPPYSGRFTPEDAGTGPCTLPGDPPLLDYLSDPFLLCPP